MLIPAGILVFLTKMKKWEGYTLTTFVKIGKNRHLLKFDKKHTIYSKLNADSGWNISFPGRCQLQRELLSWV
ncbi:hypothetical protein OUZ56_004467 [Daphnia magna]|uniref:Uncharacterized protein n=1 Tax=Daphnia magna TaxID=35525 RepID=A0ABQ9YPV7_9CRUS|nr:hypothetical protein OUZ56_004467 [Daphnia magna]